MSALPENSQERKHIPLATGLFDYFPDALVEVAKLSWEGNEKHNPGEPLHWAREKSNDHRDCILRHFLDAGPTGYSDRRIEHLRALVWRGMAELQLACEGRKEHQNDRIE